MLNPTEKKGGIENAERLETEVVLNMQSEKIKKVDADIKTKLGKEYVAKIRELKKPKLRKMG